MKYQMKNAVWELTMACNMRCKHCGSVCSERHPDELTTKEALALCDELGALGMKEVTLSGGELTLRDDWHLIGKRLTENGIATTMITNGWLLNDTMIENAKDAGIRTIAISIDGLKETHDSIRRPGSFDKDMENIQKINAAGLHSGIITTVHEKNFPELEDMYQCFSKLGIYLWQLQLALPMGSFTHHKDLYIKKEHISELIDFAYSKINEPMYICLGDCVGYYTEKGSCIHEKVFGEKTAWAGCPAGKFALGILCNGDIVGCTSIRNKEFIEGNIRNTSLREIWENEENFKWNRQLQKKDLKGLCQECVYGDRCLGGCSNSRFCFGNDIYSENEYCVWNYDMKPYKEEIEECQDVNELSEFAYGCLEKKQYQIALFALKRLLVLDKDNQQYREWYAFLLFQIGDYSGCMDENSKILERNPDVNSALKGLGLATFMNGEREKGIRLVEQSLTNGTADNYRDLYGLFEMENRMEDAKRVKDEALKRFEVDITEHAYE